MTKEKRTLANITINIPDCYDKGIQKLIRMKLVPSRSECIRIALGEFLEREKKNLRILNFNGEKLRENDSLSSKHKI